ncbi:NgoMIV family type II restriction endonuclease [Luteococcus sp. H138]|uniref:NgoMIV family type II restriction endonuclease n=1 Tax=Luteococcus sp. H138 TaxID=3139404 RepID=UPI00313E1446
MTEALLTKARQDFHRALLDGALVVSSEGIASNADGSQASSRKIALHIARALGAAEGVKLPGQSAGSKFEKAVTEFVTATMPTMTTLRPGSWTVRNVGGSRGEYHLAHFEPYTHLDDLANAIKQDRTLESVLGNSYSVSPDVVVTRAPEPDDVINRDALLVDSDAGNMSIIRAANSDRDIVHAVVSCKWTLRSDRAQNARSEALSVIRNRKGRTPHVVVVTGEPTPSRLASLALGTGDLDMVYHFALPELMDAVDALGNDEASAMLHTLVSGKRLRDIADLSLDLAV